MVSNRDEGETVCSEDSSARVYHASTVIQLWAIFCAHPVHNSKNRWSATFSADPPPLLSCLLQLYQSENSDTSLTFFLYFLSFFRLSLYFYHHFSVFFCCVDFSPNSCLKFCPSFSRFPVGFEAQGMRLLQACTSTVIETYTIFFSYLFFSISLSCLSVCLSLTIQLFSICLSMHLSIFLAIHFLSVSLHI